VRKQAKEQAERARKRRKNKKSVNPENGIVIENPAHQKISTYLPVGIPTTSGSVESTPLTSDRYTAEGVKMPRFVILDMSFCSFIDNDGVAVLKSLLTTLSELNIRLLLARCTGKLKSPIYNH